MLGAEDKEGERGRVCKGPNRDPGPSGARPSAGLPEAVGAPQPWPGLGRPVLNQGSTL